MRRPQTVSHPLLKALGFVVALACVSPLAWLLIAGLGESRDGLMAVFAERATHEALVRSLALSVGLGVACSVVCVPIAWLLHATDLPLRRFFRVALVLPLAVPSYVSAYVVVALFGPAGAWATLAERLSLPLAPDVQGTFGVVLALAPVYPLALLPLLAALSRLDPAQFEAARSLGLGPWSTFGRVVLPQLRVAGAGGALMVALYTLSDFGAVSLLRYPTLSYVVYLRYRSPFGRDEAIAVALVLALAAVIIIALHRWVQPRRATQARGTVNRRWAPIALGRWRGPASALCVAVATYGVLIPAGVVGWWLVRGMALGNPVSFPGRETLATLLLAACAALVVVLAAAPPALLRRFGSPRVAAFVRVATSAGYAMPGIVVALAFVTFGARWATPLYQTLPLLLIAYGVRFLPLAVQTMSDGIDAQNRRTFDAARSLGSTAQQAWLRVALPVAWPMIAAAAIAVFISVVKELPVTLLLAPLGVSTLATRIWSLTSEAYFTAAAPPILIMLALAAGALLWNPDARRRDSGTAPTAPRSP